MRKIKVLAIASAGGHWVQMMRLKPLFDRHETIYACTEKKLKTLSLHETALFFTIPDGNAESKLSLIIAAICVARLIIKIRPDLIITTGAAPGFFAILWGHLVGAKSIWIDSMANAESLSLSGKKAIGVADIVLTQWKHIASPDMKVQCWGRVL